MHESFNEVAHESINELAHVSVTDPLHFATSASDSHSGRGGVAKGLKFNETPEIMEYEIGPGCTLKRRVKNRKRP